MHYRRDIEGLRALAVIPVLLFHAHVPGFDGGYAGVDIFFVISGYLITATILADIAAGRFTLRGFYERRARRLLPALFAVLAASTIAAALVMIPGDYRNHAQALGAAALFAANLLFAIKVDYFDSTEGFQPLLHLWSLAVEEQFYLLFPLALLAVARARGGWLQPRVLFALLTGVALASLALAAQFAPQHREWAFFLLPTRMWELLVGGALAALPVARRSHGGASLLGLAMIVGGFALIGPQTPAPGPMFLLPTLGTALVLRHCGPATLAGRLLSLRPAVAIGGASYGIYLWHNPLLAFLDYVWFGPMPWPLVAAALLLAVTLGFASLHLIERPVRQRQRLRCGRAILVFSAGGMALALAVGLAGHWRVLPGPDRTNAASLAASSIAIPPRPAFVLYGDSHARQYHAALSARFGPGALLSESACLSLPGMSNQPYANAQTHACMGLVDQLVALMRKERVRTLYWAQRWERPLFATGSFAPMGSTADAGSARLTDAIRRLIAQLPPGTRIVLIGNVPTAAAAAPQLAGGLPRCRRYLNVSCPVRFAASRAEARSINAALAAFAARTPGVAYADTARALCEGDTCHVERDGRMIYADDTHLTPWAARAVVAGFPAP